MNKYAGDEKRRKLKRILYLLILLCVGGFFILFKLGSSQVPETRLEQNKGAGKNAILLEFDQEYSFSALHIFLGNLDKRKIEIYYLDGFDGKWKTYSEDTVVNSVLTWNKVDLSFTTKSILIRGVDEAFVFQEMVFQNADRQTVVPVNASLYPELFDEQSKFPIYPTYYDGTTFDEIYYARTAYEMINGMDPEEWTHPPFGKILMTIGVTLFGVNPLGWRIMVALLGILMIPLVYLITEQLTGNEELGLLAGLLLLTDFMHLALSRICTIDIMVAFFILLTFYFQILFVKAFRKEEPLKRQFVWLALCGISLGFSISTKWTGVYAGVGIAVILFSELIPWWIRNRKKKTTLPIIGKYFGICFSFFIVIPLVMYTLSYIPFLFVEGENRNLFQIVLYNIDRMLNFHKTINVGHVYESNWYTWLIDWRPVVVARNYAGYFDGVFKYSLVAVFGNPVIMFTGLVAVVYDLYRWIRYRDENSKILCIGYFCMLLPWVSVTRTVFIYQYFVCILFMIMHLAYGLSKIRAVKIRKIVGIVLLSLCGIAFAMYYPILTGAIPLSKEYVEQVLEVFPKWTFF